MDYFRSSLLIFSWIVTPIQCSDFISILDWTVLNSARILEDYNDCDLRHWLRLLKTLIRAATEDQTKGSNRSKFIGSEDKCTVKSSTNTQ